jgi:uncharacterized membrane protein YraQ (UPF0718 family)
METTVHPSTSEENVAENGKECQCHCSCGTKAPASEPVKLGRKLKITGSVFLLIFGLSFIPVFQPFRESLTAYMGMIWWAVALGLLLGGVIDYFVPDGFIFKYLGKGKYRSVFNAVLAGFLMSACSHGILAISMQLYKKGANIPAVIAFLLASPWANLPMTILLFGFFGWKALAFVLAAMVIAVITGFVFIFLEARGWIEPSQIPDAVEDYQWTAINNFNWKDSLKGTWRGSVSLANMVLWWILIGVLAAAILGAYVPAEFAMQYIGPGIAGLLVTLAIATVIEICSEGSAPIAFEIFKLSGGLGNPFVFLMAGVATDYTEIGILWSNIGKRTAIWLPVVTVPQILAIAILFNQFL